MHNVGACDHVCRGSVLHEPRSLAVNDATVVARDAHTRLLKLGCMRASKKVIGMLKHMHTHTHEHIYVTHIHVHII